MRKDHSDCSVCNPPPAPTECHCAATSTVLCDYCTANLCERCTEAPDLCTCPTDGAPETQEEVTAPTSPEREFEAEHGGTP